MSQLLGEQKSYVTALRRTRVICHTSQENKSHMSQLLGEQESYVTALRRTRLSAKLFDMPVLFKSNNTSIKSKNELCCLFLNFILNSILLLYKIYICQLIGFLSVNRQQIIYRKNKTIIDCKIINFGATPLKTKVQLQR